jgi:hypothetical protein
MHEIDLPLAKGQLWDVVTRPEYVAIINASNTARVEGKKNGRIGVDATYYCAHGKSISRQTIVDWQPPDESPDLLVGNGRSRPSNHPAGDGGLLRLFRVQGS